ncbi:class I SAM-dependent methyltransferase [Saccharopolyspora flava]|uniref:Ubiquinone/menaquinone biosynthesis C-methylase UbiE n=1 Tax=Saccharopolyspora flava TaxID=95161 RepID=A0A1I6S8F2_9PSEU|nr:class I SAM-dependent methyltransferase [Saccharopolyspora flava]SFS73174.1 Ubiquinone/menaquinone biosynthesis C-methylase UbiE [Saccharopolyspora flava]
MTRSYVFTSEDAHVAEQHRCLAEAYDGITTGRLAETGVGDGWRCLDVGTGGGSIARWLAERVAPTGSVLATDLAPVEVEPHPNLTVAVHDITTDPLPEEHFDLVVVRMLLQHFPQREAVLRALVRSLKPGGWLQVDELDAGYEPVLLATDAALYEKFLAAKTGHMRSRGGNPEWGREAAAAMRAAGLVAIDPRPHIGTRHAGSPELMLQLNHTHHLRDGLLAAGMTDAELERVREVMRDPGFRASSSVLHSVQGRKP